MTPRQFFNGLVGHYNQEEERVEAQRALLFSGLRFNASSISAGLSSKLSKHLSRYKFPWEIDQSKLKEKGSKFISYDKISESLNMISETNNQESKG